MSATTNLAGLRITNVPETDQWTFDNWEVPISCLEAELNKLKTLMRGEKYVQMPESIAYSNVPDIEMELNGMGEATVFNCLFSGLVKLGWLRIPMELNRRIIEYSKL